MASHMKFALDDGTVVYLETVEGPKGAGGLLPPTKGESTTDQKPVPFDKSFDAVSKLAAAMVKKLHEAADTGLEDVNITFGLKASNDVSTLVVSRGGMDVNFNISVHWRKENKKDE
jgi:hypothetical protein